MTLSIIFSFIFFSEYYSIGTLSISFFYFGTLSSSDRLLSLLHLSSPLFASVSCNHPPIPAHHHSPSFPALSIIQLLSPPFPFPVQIPYSTFFFLPVFSQIFVSLFSFLFSSLLIHSGSPQLCFSFFHI